MTTKEKDFINALAKKVLRINQEQEANYEDLTHHIARLYILTILTAVCLLLISFIK